MTAAATLSEALAPITVDPSRSAVLFDVDGTLAPIVRYASDANVPEPTRARLIAIARKYGLVACVTGRRAAEARRIVALGTIAYVGNHGGEVLRAGELEPELDPDLAEGALRVQAFAREHERDEPVIRRRLRVEDKGAIVAFHWRGAPDEEAARAAVADLAAAAEREGLHTHWGRKVLEIRPPVAIDKGRGVTALLERFNVSSALYAGDDATDLDAFRALGRLVDEGRLERVVRVGVLSDEAPAEIEREADVTVDGPPGVRRLLDMLAESS